jgi:hypothetical protein
VRVKGLALKVARINRLGPAGADMLLSSDCPCTLYMLTSREHVSYRNDRRILGLLQG